MSSPIAVAIATLDRTFTRAEIEDRFPGVIIAAAGFDSQDEAESWLRDNVTANKTPVATKFAAPSGSVRWIIGLFVGDVL
jgi:hypothetical protein